MSDPKIYSDRLSVSAYSSNSEASGYEASKLDKIAVGHEYRSATVGSLVRVVFDLGSALPVRAIHFNRVNFASATIKRGASDPPGTTVGTIESATDRRGLRRATLAVNASSRYWSIEIAAGMPTDGEAFWRIGFAALFETANDFPGMRVESEIRHTQGGETQVTPREDTVRNTIGPIRAHWSGNIIATRSSDTAARLERLAQAGMVLVDPGIGGEWIFPSKSHALETAVAVGAVTESTGFEIDELC